MSNVTFHNKASQIIYNSHSLQKVVQWEI